MVNPPYLKHLLGKQCVFEVLISGGEIQKNWSLQYSTKKRSIKNGHIFIQDMTGGLIHCVVRFQKFQWRLSILFPSDFWNVCQGQAFLNGPVENATLSDTHWYLMIQCKNLAHWRFETFFFIVHPCWRRCFHVFFDGWKQTPTQLKFFFKTHSSFGIV